MTSTLSIENFGQLHLLALQAEIDAAKPINNAKTKFLPSQPQ